MSFVYPISPPDNWGMQKPPLGIGVDHGNPLAQKLLAFWALREGAGLYTYNAAARSMHGALVGMNPSSDWIGSPAGPVLDFDGFDDYVDFGNKFSPTGIGDLTLFILFRPRMVALTNGGLLSNSQGWSSNTMRCTLEIYNNNSLRLLIGDGYNYSEAHSDNNVLTANQWHAAVVAWHPSGTVAWYVNGRLCGANTITRPLAAGNSNWRMGRNYESPAYYFDGQIAAAGIWRRALSEDDARRLSTDPYGVFQFGDLFSSVFETPGPYQTVEAAISCTGSAAGANFCAGATVGQDYHTGAVEGQLA